MRPQAGELLHFSENPDIAEFVPHVAGTAADRTPYIWAVNAAHAPSYWFPRQCPRAMAWVSSTTTEDDRQRILGPHVDRVHMVEYGWLHSVQTTQIFAYRFDAAEFTPYGDELDPHAFVAQHPVSPLAPAEPIGDLLALHAQAGIELRLATSLWPWWHATIATSVNFSGIRLRNAAHQPDEAPPSQRPASSGPTGAVG